jgi:bifunctional NMN adenylyltransferase/nudix hydrolase
MIKPRSTNKYYDLAVLIGRFQPFHKGHLSVVRNALAHAEKVLILVGSANRARDTYNPFIYRERQKLIFDVLQGEHDLWTQGFGALDAIDGFTGRILVGPLADTPYDKPAWINAVNTAARGSTTALRPRICLTGNIRDATSEYLTWFPAWDYVRAGDTGINATAIRAAYFDGEVDFQERGWKDRGLIWPEVCPQATIDFLDAFRTSEEFQYLMVQQAAEKAYREKWGEGPFQTVDPVIIKGDHVLMIQRGGEEGTGSIGLPGGFLGLYERAVDGAARGDRGDRTLPVGAGAPPERPADTRGDRGGCGDAQELSAGRGERFDDPHRSRRGHLISRGLPVRAAGRPRPADGEGHGRRRARLLDADLGGPSRRHLRGSRLHHRQDAQPLRLGGPMAQQVYDHDKLPNHLAPQPYNPIADTDSYKLGHWRLYRRAPPSCTATSRAAAGATPAVMLAAFQRLLYESLGQPITRAHVEEMAVFCPKHGFKFNREGWEIILNEYAGKLPLLIKAAPEGLMVPVRNALISVENLDPRLPWLTSYFETMILRDVWTAATIAARIFYMAQRVNDLFAETSDNPDVAVLDPGLLLARHHGLRPLGDRRHRHLYTSRAPTTCRRSAPRTTTTSHAMAAYGR